MGNWDRAVKEWRLAQRICPRCKATNTPRASALTITQEQNGSLSCSNCAHNWQPKDTE
jgi:formate dehydrogenase maturation protein FdhE